MNKSLVDCNNKISRIKDISDKANKDIDEFLNMKLHKYIGLEL